MMIIMLVRDEHFEGDFEVSLDDDAVRRMLFGMS
jgi:hypothetical protein